jgi:hypothetical protein
MGGGHALRASLFPVGEDVRSLNPFIAKRFGPGGDAWARQVPHCEARCSSSDAVTHPGYEKTCITTRSVTHACYSAMRVLSIHSFLTPFIFIADNAVTCRKKTVKTIETAPDHFFRLFQSHGRA